MLNFKTVALTIGLIAVVAPLCIDWTHAQKTIKNSFQQSYDSSGSGPQSVYGGYNTQQQQQASPANQRRTQQTSYQRRTESVSRQQQPAYQPQQQQQQQQQPQQQQQTEETSYEQSASSQQAEADAEPAQYGAVAGQPGKDFPGYTRVPKTSFSCDGLPYDYGMYADEETGCQAYHLCYNGRKESFLCGVGTVFNQRILHCDYWYSVDCGKSSQYYSSNAYMGSSQPEPGPAQASAPAPAQAPRQASSSYNSQRTASSSNNRPSVQQPSSSYGRNTQEQVQEAY